MLPDRGRAAGAGGGAVRQFERGDAAGNHGHPAPVVRAVSLFNSSIGGAHL